MRLRRSILSSLLVAACGDDVMSPVPLAPLCGEEAPVELLELADDEEVGWIRPMGEDDGFHVIVTAEDGDEQAVEASSRRNVVVDACGEEAIELATDPSYVGWWGEALVACIGEDLVQLSGYDDPSPSILARRGCGARRVGEQWVALDAEPEATVGRLVAIDVDGTQLEVRELIADVMVSGPGMFPALVEDRAVVQTSDLAVHSVDLRTGAVALELEQAHAREWSIRAERIAYRPPVLDGDEPSPLVVRDRRTGAEQVLEVGLPMSRWFGWTSEHVLGSPPVDQGRGQRWFRVDPLRELSPPEEMHIARVRDDGMIWLGRHDEASGEYELLRWREGEAPQPAWRCTWCSVASSERGTDHIEVLVSTARQQRYQLWRIDDAGGPARMLASEVGPEHRLMDDGRVLTVLVGGDLLYGPLVVYDGMGGSGQTISSRVARRASVFSWAYDLPGEVVYEAVPEGGVHALYRARLAD